MLPKPPSQDQRTTIRKILGMRKDQRFNRCRGQSMKKVLAFEKQGDFSHSGYMVYTRGYKPRSKNGTPKKKPPCGFCELCRCERVAGQGTKGDFYGVGPETGMLGVGFCRFCINSHKMHPKIILLNARREVKVMQQYGDVSMDKEFALQEMRAETQMADQRVKAREELDLVCDLLHDLTKELVEDKKPQQYINGGKEVGYVLEDVDDVTLLKMRLDSAKLLSQLRLNDLVLDRKKFLPVDNVMQAAKLIEQAVQNAIATTKEMAVKQTLGEETGSDRPIEDYVWDLFAEEWLKIWLNLKVKSEAQKK